MSFLVVFVPRSPGYFSERGVSWSWYFATDVLPSTKVVEVGSDFIAPIIIVTLSFETIKVQSNLDVLIRGIE